MPSHVATTTGELAFGTSLSFSHTVSAGDDRILFAAIVCTGDNPGTITGVTYDGNALTPLIAEVPNTTSGQGYIWWGYLEDPPVGTANVVATISAPEAAAGIASSYSGAGTPTGQQTDRGSGTGPSVTVTSNTGDLVVGMCAKFSFGVLTFTPGANQTERGEVDEPAGGFQGVAVSDEPGSSSVTHSYTISGSANYTMSAVNLPAAGGGPTFQAAWARNSNIIL